MADHGGFMDQRSEYDVPRRLRTSSPARFALDCGRLVLLSEKFSEATPMNRSNDQFRKRLRALVQQFARRRAEPWSATIIDLNERRFGAVAWRPQSAPPESNTSEQGVGA